MLMMTCCQWRHKAELDQNETNSLSVQELELRRRILLEREEVMHGLKSLPVVTTFMEEEQE